MGEDKFYVEITPNSEIVRVGNKEELKKLNNLNEGPNELSKNETPELPNNTLKLSEPTQNKIKQYKTCGHWEKDLVYLSEIDNETYMEIGKDPIIGAYCPNCDKKLEPPK